MEDARRGKRIPFGYYYKHSADYHRRNFLYLYDSIESVKDGRRKQQLDFLLGLSSYREWEHKTRYDLGYGLVFDSTATNCLMITG